MCVILLGWQTLMILLAGHVQEFQHMGICQIKEITKSIQSKVSITTKQFKALNDVMENVGNIIELLFPAKSSPNHTPQKEILNTNKV